MMKDVLKKNWTVFHKSRREALAQDHRIHAWQQTLSELDCDAVPTRVFFHDPEKYVYPPIFTCDASLRRQYLEASPDGGASYWEILAVTRDKGESIESELRAAHAALDATYPTLKRDVDAWWRKWDELQVPLAMHTRVNLDECGVLRKVLDLRKAWLDARAHRFRVDDTIQRNLSQRILLFTTTPVFAPNLSTGVAKRRSHKWAMLTWYERQFVLGGFAVLYATCLETLDCCLTSLSEQCYVFKELMRFFDGLDEETLQRVVIYAVSTGRVSGLRDVFLDSKQLRFEMGGNELGVFTQINREALETHVLHGAAQGDDFPAVLRRVNGLLPRGQVLHGRDTALLQTMHAEAASVVKTFFSGCNASTT